MSQKLFSTELPSPSSMHPPCSKVGISVNTSTVPTPWQTGLGYEIHLHCTASGVSGKGDGDGSGEGDGDASGHQSHAPPSRSGPLPRAESVPWCHT